jgi:hypothetical protein
MLFHGSGGYLCRIDSGTTGASCHAGGGAPRDSAAYFFAQGDISRSIEFVKVLHRNIGLTNYMWNAYKESVAERKSSAAQAQTRPIQTPQREGELQCS